VHLVDRLPQQEEPAAQHDEVAAGDLLTEQGEERLNQPGNPADGEEQQQPRDERQRQADDPGAVALLGR
jgi:hypothetical protein